VLTVDKNALEHLLSSYNWWMGLSTVAVAIGILGEYVAHFVFEEEARRNKAEMAISILFGVLVLGGVGGEYIFGKKLSQVSEQLQQIADTEVAQSNLDAAAARKDAEFARKQSAATFERAAQAEQHASQENERAAMALKAAEIARKNAEGFQLQIARANDRAAAANETAERERLARLQLEARLADRTLTAAQQDTLVSRLTRFHGIVVDAIIWGDSAEIQTISGLILDSMTKAGWKVQSGQAVGGGAAVRGILVGTRTGADAATGKASDALIIALQSAGLSAGPWPFDELKPPMATMNSGFTGTAPIRIFVGSKP
jgi:hypothetical protein